MIAGRTREPTISVVLPTYNRAEVLPRAVRSVLAQSLAELELIVVDDGSTDATEAVVGSFEDPRLVYVKQPRRGRSAARNAGSRRARGRLLTFLDSDDEALPTWLEELVAACDRPRVQMVFCGVRELSRRGPGRDLLPHAMGRLFGDQRGHLLTGAFAVRRDLFLDAGGYDEQLHHAENTELGLRLIPRCIEGGGETVSLDRPLVRYHRANEAKDEAAYRRRLEAARRLLELYGDAFREEAPRAYASLRAVAGVNAARLGQLPEARRHLRRAVGADPGHLRHLGRLAIAWLPPLARRLWLRLPSA